MCIQIKYVYTSEYNMCIRKIKVYRYKHARINMYIYINTNMIKHHDIYSLSLFVLDPFSVQPQ